jgi:outer membrane protein assembly factor BamB
MPIRRLLVLVPAFFWSAFPSSVSGDDWPQWRGPGRDGRWNEPHAIDRFESEAIPIKWRAPIGPGYTGPTVADGRVFVMDRMVEPAPSERVLCFDASSGESLWTYAYECQYSGIGYQAGPRAAVSIDQDRAYALGAMGHLHCLSVEDGSIVWRRDLNHDYEINSDDKTETRMPTWGIAASPLVYGNLVILQIGGRNGACVVGLDKMSGQERWRALDDRAQYSAPIIVRQRNQDVLVVWTGDGIGGLDPHTGAVHWHHPFTPSRMPIGIATPIVQKNRLFVTSFYDGSLMLELNNDSLTVKKVWEAKGPDEQHTRALHSIISTPIWLEQYIYGVDSYGELRCLEAATGKRVWEDTSATPRGRWSTIHFVENGDRVWMQNERGELIIARLTPQGYHEISRAKLLKPTPVQLSRRDGVCWSHPAFANGHVFSRNDEELVCAKVTEGP